MKLRSIPIILAAILLAAHFLRSYNLFPMAVCLLAPLLLFIHKRWSLLALQLSTIAAALIWLVTLYEIIQQRLFEHRSWMDSAIILGAVAAFTLLAGWLLNSSQVREKYPV